MAATFSTAGKLFDGYAVNRSVFRELLPDHRWYLYAAGLVNPNDANTATISLRYQKYDTTTVTLGSVTQAGSGLVKKSMGPFDLFAVGGVPMTETVVVIRLNAQKSAGVDGTIECWNIWLRLLPFLGST